MPREPDDDFYETAADPPRPKIVWCGARDGRAATHVVCPPVRPAMTVANAIEPTRIHGVAGLTGDRTSLGTMPRGLSSMCRTSVYPHTQ
jgi:hypothetical protein